MASVALVYHRQAADGGVERNLNALALRLADAGHRVDILCRHAGAPPDPRIAVVPLRAWLPGPWRARGFAGAVAERVRRAGYDRVLAYGRTWPHDVIRLGMGCHATYLERLGLGAGLRDRVEIALEARSLAAASFRGGRRRVICNSALVAADAGFRYGLAADEVAVIPNGADLDRFHPRLRAAGRARMAAAGIAGDAPVALFLGSGFRRKGLDRCLAALARPAARDLVLAIAGRDRETARFAAAAASAGLDRRTRFLGATEAPAELLAAADVLVLPTRYDPFANVTIEALAAGAPVVTTPNNGGSEILVPGTGAVVADADDADALAAAMAAAAARGREPAARDACRQRAERFPIARTLAATAAMLGLDG